MSSAMVRRYFHKGRPVFVSSAVTWLGASEIYITPSTTMGVVSNFCSELDWYTQAGCKRAAFWSLICFSGENRWPE